MYECPNCGGNLKFDIPSQQLACDYCGAHADPYSIRKDKDAVEENYFETTLFTCPQCGGELFSTDIEATSFCSFCGASTILSSRISRERRPAYIIPFKKTKEDCKKAYLRKMRSAFFVPGELKDPKHIEEFRGIYMPYWTYQLIQQKNLHMPGKKSYRKGDYIITEHYDLSADLDASYLGYSFDASTSFYDNISEALAPYDARELIHFTPAFLSGFFADTADVDQNLYLNDAMDLADENSFNKVCKTNEFRPYAIKKPESRSKLQSYFGTTLKSADYTMYPVWFLTYRNKDRVAYATVNGQTGKVVADIPIDPRKYLLGSAAAAVPIFLLLNLVFTLRPAVLVMVSVLLACASSVIYYRELREIREKELNEGDRAIAQKAQEQTKGPSAPKSKKKKKEKEVYGSSFVLIIFLMILAIVCIKALPQMLYFASFVAAAAAIIYSICTMTERHKISDMKLSLNPMLTMAAVVISMGMVLFKPVSDLYYYGCALFTMAAVLINFVDIIHNFNRLAMRRLPQFDKRGGADRV